jgi:hypothetical protein
MHVNKIDRVVEVIDKAFVEILAQTGRGNRGSGRCGWAADTATTFTAAFFV